MSETGDAGVARRTVLAAAWAAPVVLAAVAAPMAAASGGASPARIEFNSFGLNATGPLGLIRVQVKFNYGAAVPNLVKIYVYLTWTSGGLSGTYSTNGAAGWSGEPAVLVGSEWKARVTYSGVMTPGGTDTGVLLVQPNLLFTPNPGNPGSYGNFPGATASGYAIGVDTNGDLTPAPPEAGSTTGLASAAAVSPYWG